MHLALLDLYRAKWTDDIHDEWLRNVLENRADLKRSQLKRTRDLMDAHVRDCLVSGYEDLIPKLELPDPEDRHVLAAAVKADAKVIVTFNLSDFPEARLAPYGISAQHPDIFIKSLIQRDLERVCLAVRRQRKNLKRPPLSAEQLLGVLEKQGLVETVDALRPHRDML